MLVAEDEQAVINADAVVDGDAEAVDKTSELDGGHDAGLLASLHAVLRIRGGFVPPLSPVVAVLERGTAVGLILASDAFRSVFALPLAMTQEA